MSWLFASDGQGFGTSASSTALPVHIQGWFRLGLPGLSPRSSRDYQESSPTPQFESINTLVLRFLYGQTLTSIYYYWENHSFD